MKVEIYDKSDRYKKYAVIVAFEGEKIVMVRHKDRTTWEIPGGHYEEGETIFETAKRELVEETGATDFDIEYLCDYSVEKGGNINYGGLFRANIKNRDKNLSYEIKEVKTYSDLPNTENMTYGVIQTKLYNEVKNR